MGFLDELTEAFGISYTPPEVAAKKQAAQAQAAQQAQLAEQAEAAAEQERQALELAWQQLPILTQRKHAMSLPPLIDTQWSGEGIPPTATTERWLNYAVWGLLLFFLYKMVR